MVDAVCVGDSIELDIDFPFPWTWKIELTTGEAAESANLLLSDETSGWRKSTTRDDARANAVTGAGEDE